MSLVNRPGLNQPKSQQASCRSDNTANKRVKRQYSKQRIKQYVYKANKACVSNLVKNKMQTNQRKKIGQKLNRSVFTIGETKLDRSTPTKNQEIMLTDFSGGKIGKGKFTILNFFLESQCLHISLFQREGKMRTRSDFAA